MKNIRLRGLAVLLITLLCLAGMACAQAWSPAKPVRIIVPIVGSTNDVLARLVAPKLQEVLGQPVIVENKSGAGGNIGADFVAKAPPDGHTLLVGYNGPLAINVTLFDKMPFDPLKDLAPITLAVKSPQYLVVNPGTGITSVEDLVAKAKRAPSSSRGASWQRSRRESSSRDRSSPRRSRKARPSGPRATSASSAPPP